MSLNAATGATPSASAASSSAALNAISGNFNDFLTLLTTQLQNQDPSSPMDTSQFTSELAQFSGVQQAVDTNTNLTSLIQITQGQALLQGSSLLGKQVELNSTTLPLQNSAAQLQFSAAGPQPVQITVTDAQGNVVANQTVQASTGVNSWSWNGQNAAGVTEPDGAYTASVAAVGSNGTTTPLGFTTGGIVTGVDNTGSAVNLQMGPSSIALSSVASIGG